MVKKLNVTPKEKKRKNNLCTTRPALLVKIKKTEQKRKKLWPDLKPSRERFG